MATDAEKDVAFAARSTGNKNDTMMPTHRKIGGRGWVGYNNRAGFGGR